MQYAFFNHIIKNKTINKYIHHYNSGLDGGWDMYSYNNIMYNINNPLIYDIVSKLEENDLQLKEKTICIEFAETEDGKELFVKQNGRYNKTTEKVEYEESLKTERTILKTTTWNYYLDSNNARIIYVGDGINDESLNATDEEKIKYVNMINADLYVRIEIYDDEINSDDYKKIDYGYYNINNYNVASSMININIIVSEKEFNEMKSEYLSYSKYLNYDEYKKEMAKENKDIIKKSLIKINNELFEKQCEIPTIINFTGRRYKEDGKYFVSPGGYNSMFTTWSENEKSKVEKAIETEDAQKQIKENKGKNEKIKEETENKIKNIKLTNNEEEIQKEIKLKNANVIKFKVEESFFKKNKDKIIYSLFAFGILICIIIIIKGKKSPKNKNTDNNQK